MLARLDLINWGLPGERIMDKDHKFLSQFWTALFTKLGVKLLYSTAYHPQTDGSSKRTNKTVKIALHFFVHGLFNLLVWPGILTKIQSLLNNTSFSTTGKTPNEIAYRFSTTQLLDLLAANPTLDVTSRLDTTNAIAFTTASQKEHYNRMHKPLFMKVDKWATLRLYKRYSIPSTWEVNKKLT